MSRQLSTRTSCITFEYERILAIPSLPTHNWQLHRSRLANRQAKQVAALTTQTHTLWERQLVAHCKLIESRPKEILGAKAKIDTETGSHNKQKHRQTDVLLPNETQPKQIKAGLLDIGNQTLLMERPMNSLSLSLSLLPAFIFLTAHRNRSLWDPKSVCATNTCEPNWTTGRLAERNRR